MEQKRKGIKRHEALYPLSHHHHHALFLALKLRRAGTDKSKLTTMEIKNELIQFWDNGGQEHFREEEEVLLPSYALHHGSINQPEIIEMLLEHVNIRALIQKIKQMDSDLEPVLQQLGNMLEAHIRKEERILFPMIEKALPEEALEALAPYLHKL